MVFRPTDHDFDDCFGAPRNADAREITTARIRVYLEVFRPAEHVFEDDFDELRYADAPQTIS